MRGLCRPWKHFSAGSAGVYKPIQNGGARLVTNVKGILEALNLFMMPQHVEMQAALPDNAEEPTLSALLISFACQQDFSS